ncbi:porin family protein [Daejeonella oryzae]|uniref:porin family protein n=1 Tax=Daejeonella oryzae TaxID=1122943 RepID=UPI000400F602|nr:porin family protein [Daejeonella oryzae]
MKKLLIIAIGVFAAGAANAQNVSFGVKAGANLSNIIKTDDESFKTDFKPGLHAGLTMEIGLGNTFSFAPELMFSQKGYKSERTLGTLTQTTNWIEIPVLAKIQAAPKFNIFLGPQVSFLTKTTNKFEGSFGTAEQTINEDSDNFRKSIAGGVVGAGFDITPKIGLSARYALDFQKNNENGTSETPVFRNQVIQAGLGFKF